MPKNFIFYNPDHHKRIYALLEEKKPAAIIAATEKNPELAGALYPFPLIEDGDFDIPSVYCASSTGSEIALNTGKKFRLSIDARRIPATACNVLAAKNRTASHKIVILAHIDAYWCTPGAVDNASGVTVLLLLAEMLRDYNRNLCVEIIAVNGEDYYSAGGEMDYLRRYGHDMSRIALAVNIDGAGYRKGKTAYSLYACQEDITRLVKGVFSHHEGLVEGVQWPQSDHSMFVQRGIPAIAMTTEEFVEVSSTIAHTPVDTPDLIDYKKLVEVAHALYDLIMSFPDN
jgi:aminopeptidase YwaD